MLPRTSFGRDRCGECWLDRAKGRKNVNVLGLATLRAELESTVPESAVGRHAAFDAGAFDVVDPGADEAFVLFCDEVVEASVWESCVSG